MITLKPAPKQAKITRVLLGKTHNPAPTPMWPRQLSWPIKVLSNELRIFSAMRLRRFKGGLGFADLAAIGVIYNLVHIVSCRRNRN